MRKLLALPLLLFGLVPLAHATTVTATVTDANSNPYANGTVTAILSSTAGVTPTVGGTSIANQTGFYLGADGRWRVDGALNSSGALSLALPAASTVTPSGTTFSFRVCALSVYLGPAVQQIPICFDTTTGITITGSSQSVSTQLNAVALPLGPSPSSGGGAVDSVFGRTGVVVAASDDYSCTQVTSCVSNPMNTLGDSFVGGTSGTPTRVAGPTGPNSVPQVFTSTPSGGAATQQAWKLSGVGGRSVSGTTDTVAEADRLTEITYTSGSSVAVTVPQAGSTTGTGSNFAFRTKVTGAGTVTFTPTTSTVNGAATLAQTPGTVCNWFSFDNTNYIADCVSIVGSTKFACEPGLGDGQNAITAATYTQLNCINKTDRTWTITGINCWTDNAGTSTLNAANNAATGLLTGAVTCNNTKSGGGAAGTQSATVTLAPNDAITFTFVSDGTTKTTTWSVSLTR